MQRNTHTHVNTQKDARTRPAGEKLAAPPSWKRAQQACAALAPPPQPQKQQSRLSQIGQSDKTRPNARCLPGKINKSALINFGLGQGRVLRGGVLQFDNRHTVASIKIFAGAVIVEAELRDEAESGCV